MNVAILASVLFAVGLYGVLTRRDLIAVLASVEVMLGGASVMLVGLATTIESAAAPEAGVVEAVGLFIIILAAAEAAVALGIVMAVARRRRTTRVDDLTEVSG
ncbi:MAG: NADH-quinone oxidoreductase subunit NuoK [Coriobacteriia bacterium]|nr:NADH-quinone oxidoreductase subunit NuoK [Coriobacteriia bacterium]